MRFVKGTDFLLEGGENTLRLAYSGVTADQIDEGVRASPRPVTRWPNRRRTSSRPDAGARRRDEPLSAP